MEPTPNIRLQPPQKRSHPVDIGLRTEAAVLAELVRRGYEVLVPFGTNQRYDLVLDVNGEFVRVQVKTGRLRNGVVTFKTTSTRANTLRAFTRGYRGEADVFLVHCAATDGIYVVPVDEAGNSHCSLRVHPTRNGQAECVRWAREYELPG